MAPTPAGSQSAKAVPGVVAELADCLGGTVHLAYAQASGLDVVVAGFARYEAQTRARAIARATALDRLHRLPHHASSPKAPASNRRGASRDGLPASDLRGASRDGLPASDLRGALPASGLRGVSHDGSPTPDPRGRELRLSDFLSDPPEAVGLFVPGTGLVSGNRYQLPAEVVWLGERETQVEAAMTGVVDLGIAEAIAEIIAHDVVARWWARPSQQPLLRLSAQLDRLLPTGVMAAATGLGLRVSAFALAVPDLRIAMVTVGGEGATLGVAAGRTVRSAIGEAFLRAMAAKAQPWATLALPEALRRFAVWHREGDYAAHLERLGVDAEPWLIGEPGDLRPASWPEIAARRFGHEPVAVESGGTGTIVKVVCPGAACYRATSARLPCPVP
ncbi:hypothetical protein [Nonomuraea insulae]|uniref:YcaO domain-containing protein n=1 Tax=Nonomuraea insulae TaxID=1616787 RepID=A0ABW1CQI9_9ACTN